MFNIIPILIVLQLSQCQLDIKIYIESLCPDTQNAMKAISNSTITEIDSIANVEFIVAGRVDIKAHQSNTYYTKCQHGESECYGNMILACGLELQQNQQEKTKYVKCFFENVNRSCGGERNKCFTQSLDICLSYQQRLLTLMCANGPQGIELFHKNIQQTQKHVFDFIPSVEMEGSIIKLTSDFGKLICRGRNPPIKCDSIKWL